jgi:hypothetical protein
MAGARGRQRNAAAVAGRAGSAARGRMAGWQEFKGRGGARGRDGLMVAVRAVVLLLYWHCVRLGWHGPVSPGVGLHVPSAPAATAAAAAAIPGTVLGMQLQAQQFQQQPFFASAAWCGFPPQCCAASRS